jgi:hypothetical protein
VKLCNFTASILGGQSGHTTCRLTLQTQAGRAGFFQHQLCHGDRDRHGESLFETLTDTERLHRKLGPRISPDQE